MPWVSAIHNLLLATPATSRCSTLEMRQAMINYILLVRGINLVSLCMMQALTYLGDQSMILCDSFLQNLKSLLLAGRERNKDGGTAIHQGVYSQHKIQAQDREKVMPVVGRIMDCITFSLACVVSFR